MKVLSFAGFVAFAAGVSLHAAAADVAVTISDQTLTPMKSPWADYFGTHYASTPDEAGRTWNTVRSYGGTHVGIAAENPAAPPRQGPFTGREVRFTLEDFHGPRGGKTDRKLRDGETVEWGGRRLTFHLAAGHTPGTLFTEFPLRDKSSGKMVTAGILGGIAPGAAFAQTAAKLRAVDVQLWLGAHPEQNKTFDKQRRLHTGTQPSPFIDPAGWQAFLDRFGTAGSRGSRPFTRTPPKP